MCYVVYISTTSDDDLRVYNSELLRFAPLDASNGHPCTALLENPNRWYVGSKSHCSCTFRHLVETELGFGEPEDWFPEEPDDIEATKQLYAVLRQLVASGHRLDCADVWYDATPDAIKTIDVSIGDVPVTAFRLFENCRFRLEK